MRRDRERVRGDRSTPKKKARPGEKQDLVLYGPQEKHMKALLKRHEIGSRVLRDTTDTGHGKTPVAMEIATELDLVMVIFCPKQVVDSWREKMRKFKGYEEPQVYSLAKDASLPRPGQHIIISYTAINSIRNDEADTVGRFDGRDYFQFKITDEKDRKRKESDQALEGLVKTHIGLRSDLLDLQGDKKGIMFIFDESSAAKNDSGRGAFAKGLTRAVTDIIRNPLRASEDGGFRMIIPLDDSDDSSERSYSSEDREELEEAATLFTLKRGETIDEARERIDEFIERNSDKYVVKECGANTMCLYMSATPFDKEVQIMRFVYAAGLIDVDVVPRDSAGKNKVFADAIERLLELDSSAIHSKIYRFLDDNDSNWLTARKRDVVEGDPSTWGLRMKGPMVPSMSAFVPLFMDLWSKVIVPATTSEMSPFIERNAYRCYLQIDDPDDEDLKKSRDYMEVASAMAGVGGRTLYNEDDTPVTGVLAMHTAAIGEMGNICMEAMCDFAVDSLEEDKTRKVFIMFSRVKTCFNAYMYIKRQAKARKIESSLGRNFVRKMWSGAAHKSSGMDVSPQEQKLSKMLFQEDSNECRVLIGMLESSIGFDLNDTSEKGRQRYVICMPAYGAMEIHQGLGRAARAESTTIAKAFIMIPLISGVAAEAISNALNEKSDVLTKSTMGWKDKRGRGLDMQMVQGFSRKRVFPAQYPRCFYFDSKLYFVDENFIQRCNDGDLGDELTKFYANLSNNERLMKAVLSPYDEQRGVPLWDGPPKKRITPEGLAPAKAGAYVKDSEGVYRILENTTLIPNTYEDYEEGVGFDFIRHNLVNYPDEAYALFSKSMDTAAQVRENILRGRASRKEDDRI